MVERKAWCWQRVVRFQRQEEPKLSSHSAAGRCKKYYPQSVTVTVFFKNKNWFFSKSNISYAVCLKEISITFYKAFLSDDSDHFLMSFKSHPFLLILCQMNKFLHLIQIYFCFYRTLIAHITSKTVNDSYILKYGYWLNILLENPQNFDILWRQVAFYKSRQ